MKIFNVSNINIFPQFLGRRKDRNTVEQLTQNNDYNLNHNNQIRINKAIENLSKSSDKETVEFLLDTADNLKYGTNINLRAKQPYNDWRLKLNKAALKVYKNCNDNDKKIIDEKMFKTLGITQKPLTDDEKEILELKKSILSNTKSKELENVKGPMKNLVTNLDYFIISSEVSTAEKLYIMKQLDYFMSDAYEINPQLKNKKTQALAEIVNDITVNTPESEYPNTKAINQMGHGICAAISICRKALSYEQKAKYVDMVLSELDSNDYMMVYDITKLGSGTKIPVKKASMDFEYALEKGYRIVDTSAMYWMNVADMVGATNEQIQKYIPFNKGDLDVLQDSHINENLDIELINKQNFYRTLIKSRELFKKYQVKKEEKLHKERLSKNLTKNKFDTIYKYETLLENLLFDISPKSERSDIKEIKKNLLNLQVNNSEKKEKFPKELQKFSYIENEDEEIIQKKIKHYLSANYNLDEEKLEKNIDKIAEYTTEINNLTKGDQIHPAAKLVQKNKQLYSIAASYRIAQEYKLNIDENKEHFMTLYNIPDTGTLMIENLDYLINLLEKDKMNTTLKTGLKKNFEISESSDEELLKTLKDVKDTITYLYTDLLDVMYNSILSKDRKSVLHNMILDLENDIDGKITPNTITKIARVLKTKENKDAILNKLYELNNILESENLTEDKLTYVYNSIGGKLPFADFSQQLKKLSYILFVDKNTQVIPGFNLINGLDKDAPLSESAKVFLNINNNMNNIIQMINSYKQALKVTDKTGRILNTVDENDYILKKLEEHGNVPKRKDLEHFREKFKEIDKRRYNNDDKIKDMPPELIKFNSYETEILKNYQKHIDIWASNVNKDYISITKDLKPQLSEQHRKIGELTGQRWVRVEGESGLSSNQEIKIFEHMTDKPYYSESDSQKAIEKLEESNYPAISATSVSHKEPAMHAQYIAGIYTDESGKKLFMHDNSWGNSEFKNNWKDKNGRTRTDYENGYGGEKGYIVNNEYKTGYELDDILDATVVVKPKNTPSKKLKKLHGDSDYEWSMPMYRNTILQGKHPKRNDYVEIIRQLILHSPAAYLDSLSKQAQEMTVDEIKIKIKKAETIGKHTAGTYNNILSKIKGDGILNFGIKNQDDFNKLSDSDDLKIILEKVAISKSYPSITNTKKLYSISNFKDLQKFKTELKSEAIENFKYSFGKHIDIIKYGAESSRKEINSLLEQFENSNNLKVDYSKNNQIISSMKNISIKDFDGNMAHSIDTMTNIFNSEFSKYLSKFKITNDKAQDLSLKVKDILEKNMYINESDLKSEFNDDENFKLIEEFIDNKDNPKTNSEFVSIFRNYQNMTTEEFNLNTEKYLTDRILGIKTVKGFDVIKKLNQGNDSYSDSLFNIIFEQEYRKETDLSKTKPTYDYYKFSRIYNGQIYPQGRTFDDVFIDYYYDLYMLSNKKRINKISAQMFEKYGVFPGYPDIDPESKEGIKKTFDRLFEVIDENSAAISRNKEMIETYRYIDDLHAMLESSNGDKLINEKEYKEIKKRFKLVEKSLEEDDSTLNIAIEIKDLLASKTLDRAAYTAILAEIELTIGRFRYTPAGKTLNEQIKETNEELNDFVRSFVNHSIHPKYRDRAFDAINEFIKLKARYFDYSEPDKKLEYKLDKTYDKIKKIYDKHRIYQTSEEILKEYVLMHAKDYQVAKPDTKSERAVKDLSEFEIKKKSFKNLLKGLLASAEMASLLRILMTCADEANLNVVKEAFKNSSIELINGLRVAMDSNEGLEILLNQLSTEKDQKTALMFIEQLGLSERAMEVLTKKADFENRYKLINRAHSLLKSLDADIGFVHRQLKDMQNYKNRNDLFVKIDELNEKLLKRRKWTNYRHGIDLYSECLKMTKNRLKDVDQKDLKETFNEYMDATESVIIKDARDEVSEINKAIESYNMINNMVEELKIPKNSEAEKLKEKYQKDFEDFIEYCKNSNKKYPNIATETESDL